MPMNRHPGTHTVLYLNMAVWHKEYRSKGKGRGKRVKWVRSVKNMPYRIPNDDLYLYTDLQKVYA